jgi:hypothetical protein
MNKALFLGYGHLVPITPTGRVFCIGFALVGIPLLLVTIADIGQFLSEFLNYLHQAIRSFEQKVRFLIVFELSTVICSRMTKV